TLDGSRLPWVGTSLPSTGVVTGVASGVVPALSSTASMAGIGATASAAAAVAHSVPVGAAGHTSEVQAREQVTAAGGVAVLDPVAGPSAALPPYAAPFRATLDGSRLPWVGTSLPSTGVVTGVASGVVPALSSTASMAGIGVSVSAGVGGVTGVGVGLSGVARGVPSAVALLCTLPAVTSAALTVYVAVQVIVASAVSVVPGQLTGLRPGCASLTFTAVGTVSPVSARSTAWAIVEPSASGPVEVTRLASVSAGAWTVVSVSAGV